MFAFGLKVARSADDRDILEGPIGNEISVNVFLVADRQRTVQVGQVVALPVSLLLCEVAARIGDARHVHHLYVTILNQGLQADRGVHQASGEGRQTGEGVGGERAPVKLYDAVAPDPVGVPAAEEVHGVPLRQVQFPDGYVHEFGADRVDPGIKGQPSDLFMKEKKSPLVTLVALDKCVVRATLCGELSNGPFDVRGQVFW